MKRRAAPIGIRIMRVLAWVGVGAVITVGVAWGLLWVPIQRLAISPPLQHWEEDGHDGAWAVHVTTDWHATEVNATRVGNVGDYDPGLLQIAPDPALDRAPSWSFLGRLRANSHNVNRAGEVCEMASGWPFRAMRSQWSLSAAQVETRDRTSRGFSAPPPPTLEAGWDVRAFSPTLRSQVSTDYWPTWPIPLGFALNTLFYAALAWGLWQLPLALRRRSRFKKGLCVRCGYDLKGIAVGSACPECGSVPRGRG